MQRGGTVIINRKKVSPGGEKKKVYEKRGPKNKPAFTGRLPALQKRLETRETVGKDKGITGTGRTPRWVFRT